MNIARNTAKGFGAFLLLVGILGFVPPLVTKDGLLLGTFFINPAHNLIHILTGVAALAAGYYGNGAYARLYALVFGLVYAVVSLVGYTQLLFVNGQLLGFIPINTADNLF